MRIVLVHPAGSNWLPGQEDPTPAANRMAPIGVLSMASYLKDTEHQVFIHDCLGPRAPLGSAANAQIILGYKPDLVGFSCTTSAFHDAYEMARTIKAANPDTITVFGGVHISAVRGRLLEQFKDIDFISLGEGELTLMDLANGETPSQISGLGWRDGEEIVLNPPRDHIKDLDNLPFPAYEKLDKFPKGYRLPPFSYVKVPCATLITSRGCIYQCSYCDRSVFKKGFRSNSAEYIYDHMKLLATKFKVKHINVYDDLFTTNKRRITALCERLAREPLGLQFNCAVHAGHTDDDLLEMLKDAGCLMISIGMESGDADILARHKSTVTLDQVRDTVERVQSKGLRAKGLFMMGLPGETPETARRTSNFIMSLGLDDMNLSKFTPFPGAPCYPTIHDEGTFDEDWRRMNCLNFVYVPEAFGSKEALDEIYNQHVKRFYTDKAWIRTKVRSRLWQHRHTMLHFIKNLPTFMKARKAFQPKEDA